MMAPSSRVISGCLGDSPTTFDGGVTDKRSGGYRKDTRWLSVGGGLYDKASVAEWRYWIPQWPFMRFSKTSGVSNPPQMFSAWASAGIQASYRITGPDRKDRACGNTETVSL